MQDAIEFERRFQAAVQELEAAGVKPMAANPVFTRAARGLGLKVKPPFYMNFQQRACFLGLPFGIIWGALMFGMGAVQGWLVPGSFLLFMAAIAAVIFGFLMAYVVEQQRRRLDLRDWDAL